MQGTCARLVGTSSSGRMIVNLLALLALRPRAWPAWLTAIVRLVCAVAHMRDEMPTVARAASVFGAAQTLLVQLPTLSSRS
jgi:hypothetical protein